MNISIMKLSAGNRLESADLQKELTPQIKKYKKQLIIARDRESSLNRMFSSVYMFLKFFQSTQFFLRHRITILIAFSCCALVAQRCFRSLSASICFFQARQESKSWRKQWVNNSKPHCFDASPPVKKDLDYSDKYAVHMSIIFCFRSIAILK